MSFSVHKGAFKWWYNDNDNSDNSNNGNITAAIATTTTYNLKKYFKNVIVTHASWNSITDMFATKILSIIWYPEPFEN